MNIEEKLQAAGVKLPQAAAPVGAYLPAVRSECFVYTSGQLPMSDGSLIYTGKVGQDVSVQEAYDAARLCAVNALSAVKSAVGDLNKVKRIVKVTGFVNSTPDFTDQAKVLNGASELFGLLFSDGHARSAVGTAALPLDAAVEVEIIAEVTE